MANTDGGNGRVETEEAIHLKVDVPVSLSEKVPVINKIIPGMCRSGFGMPAGNAC